ncbi:glycogen/starch/alpha-glucan phosphorylase [Lachnoclostridium sp. Marseille-P6806]|uniref:glycogen/starch/alpha-glucan phosphorylase n=1 Tax=Lachnoclostridium sp. Marseille-P6806 TaxID=2364793 RepID=UPI00102F734A|nr:glycogen/starch/alpha-glucan phosphorylase [Lachnoclostridium sp. Marseille-P6806]
MAAAKKAPFTFDKELFKRSVEYNIRTMYRRERKEASKQEVFQAAAQALRDQIIDCWMKTQKAFEEQDPKQVVYLSMEFLMGRAFGNDAINLGAYRAVGEALKELGFDINAIEDEEPDAALGNGGLGRLAACFLDSLATLNYPAYGCGIRYHYGMFRQKIVDGYQVEVPDNWLRNGNPLEIKRPEYTQEVRFGGYVSTYTTADGRLMYRQEGYQRVRAVPYDLPVIGYGNGFVDTLRIWDAEPIVEFHLDSFDKGDYNKAVEEENLAKLITEVLYPCDDHYQGKELRLKQQYFFVSASIQQAVKKYLTRHRDLTKLDEKYVFQLNDTHPTLTVPELMRILMDDCGLSWDDAWGVVTRSCAYTNHTIMAEALEKWPIELFSKLLPRIYQIVEEINRRFLIMLHERYDNTDADVNAKIRKMAVIYDGQVRMANLAIVAGFSVNGVARLHTQILEQQELRDFYELFPQKFSNKTNGITQRRFLLHGNPLLADWVTEHVGEEWITDLSRIADLRLYADDARAQREFMQIKYKNKQRLAKYILEHNGITVDPHSIYDVQVKRLHEYKRQLLNILHVMYLYNQIKANPGLRMNRRTFIFGAKAAAGYRNAKLTIKLINAVADVSEQISTASKEASGTGNMKLMLNGALTVGTLDGANVEMLEEVGKENMFIFGLTSEEVIGYETNGGYQPYEIFNSDQNVRQVLMQLVNGSYSPDDPERFRPLYNSLLGGAGVERADRYFILKDFEAYAEAQRRIDAAYSDTRSWARMALLNTAAAGKFSSDRTIEEYVRDIWHLKKVFADRSGAAGGSARTSGAKTDKTDRSAAGKGAAAGKK